MMPTSNLLRFPRPEPQNILLTRLSAIGDCVLTIPLAVDIKKLWPNAKLTWIVDCAAEQLIKHHECVDEVVRIERKWMHRPSNWTDYRSLLRGKRFDLVFDPQGLSKSSMLAWLSGARTRVGFDFSHGRELAPLLANKRVHRSATHMADTYRQLLSPWTEVKEHTGEFRMPCFEEAAAKAKGYVEELKVGDDWIAINPGAGWTTRLWPIEKFVRLAREIRAAFDRRCVVFWAGENERLMASVIAEESGGAAVIAPSTNLQELLEMFRLCSILVTGDTGPLHVASSIGTPRVAIHGPTWAEETGPYRNSFINIQSPISTLGGKLQRSGDNTMMKAIEVPEVLDAVGKLIKLEKSAELNTAVDAPPRMSKAS